MEQQCQQHAHHRNMLLGVHNTTRLVPSRGSSSLQVENMPADEFAALWQRYIAAFAELLLEATPASPPECPALQRLVGLAALSLVPHLALAVPMLQHAVVH